MLPSNRCCTSNVKLSATSSCPSGLGGFLRLDRIRELPLTNYAIASRQVVWKGGWMIVGRRVEPDLPCSPREGLLGRNG